MRAGRRIAVLLILAFFASVPPWRAGKVLTPALQAAVKPAGGDPEGCLTPRCHAGLVRRVVVSHAPLEEEGCSACHEGSPIEHPANSGEEFTLKEGSVQSLCFSCHKEMASVILGSNYAHTPAKAGRCTACHTPHGGQFTNLLVKFKPPDPHWGTAVTDMGITILCWDCHDRKMAVDEKSESATAFRNGDRNLHFVHVTQRKGRTCKACHNAHASGQVMHLNHDVPFGRGGWRLPIEYTKTATGGSCVVGCHRELNYDRKNPVSYPYGGGVLTPTPPKSFPKP